MFMIDHEEEKVGTLPAACQVDPAVSSFFSKRTQSVQPALARWYRADAPTAPPPMITTRAWVGKWAWVYVVKGWGSGENAEDAKGLALEFKAVGNSKAAQPLSSGLLRVQMSGTSSLQFKPRSGGLAVTYRAKF